jgi:hypothetical protein
MAAALCPYETSLGGHAASGDETIIWAAVFAPQRGYDRCMSTGLRFARPPRFAVDRAGRPVDTTLNTADCIELLIQAKVVNPEMWPPSMEQGAAALSRIRDIEAGCVGEHGRWDWELLPEDLQDAYDLACSQLSVLRSAGEAVALDTLVAGLPKD